MIHNVLRQRLLEDKPTAATRIWSTWPYMTELAGVCGHFDYIEFDAEYSPCSQIDMENIARAAELHGMGSLIKVDFQNRGFVAQKAVAAGFQGVLFTDHRTPEDFRESIRMMRSETPHAGGQFGYPSRRFIGAQTYMPQMDHARRVDQVVLAFMIEKAEAVERIEEICAIPGIDMVQFGPSDYCLSMGWNMDEHREEVRKAEQTVIRTALAHGIRPRCEIPNAQAAAYYVELGVKDFCVGDEIASFRQFLSKEGSALQNMIQTTFQ